jgi:hypothetical protein
VSTTDHFEQAELSLAHAAGALSIESERYHLDRATAHAVLALSQSVDRACESFATQTGDGECR